MRKISITLAAALAVTTFANSADAHGFRHFFSMKFRQIPSASTQQDNSSTAKTETQPPATTPQPAPASDAKVQPDTHQSTGNPIADRIAARLSDEITAGDTASEPIAAPATDSGSVCHRYSTAIAAIVDVPCK